MHAPKWWPASKAMIVLLIAYSSNYSNRVLQARFNEQSCWLAEACRTLLHAWMMTLFRSSDHCKHWINLVLGRGMDCKGEADKEGVWG